MRVVRVVTPLLLVVGSQYEALVRVAVLVRVVDKPLLAVTILARVVAAHTRAIVALDPTVAALARVRVASAGSNDLSTGSGGASTCIAAAQLRRQHGQEGPHYG